MRLRGSKKSSLTNESTSLTFTVVNGIEVLITYTCPHGEEAILAALLFDINNGLFKQTTIDQVFKTLNNTQKINFVNQLKTLYNDDAPVVDPCEVFKGLNHQVISKI